MGELGHWGFHFDSNGVEGTSFSDLNLTKIDQYFNRYEIDFSRETDTDRFLVPGKVLKK